jgi:hypothetical protein
MINLAKPLILHGYGAAEIKMLKNVYGELSPRSAEGKKCSKLGNFPK